MKQIKRFFHNHSHLYSADRPPAVEIRNPINVAYWGFVYSIPLIIITEKRYPPPYKISEFSSSHDPRRAQATSSAQRARGWLLRSSGCYALFHIHEVLGSSLCSETSCCELSLSWFPWVLYLNSRAEPSSRPRQLPSAFFPIHYSLIFLPFDTIRSKILASSLNNP